MNLTPLRRDIELGPLVPGLDGYRLAADVFLPAPGAPSRNVALCCLSGGGASQAYWNLRTSEPGFATLMAEAGFPVICVDHLGTGDSPLPRSAEPPLLSEVVAADAAAFLLLLDELRETMPGLLSVGIGHSMGAGLTVLLQTRHGVHDAIALLGFGTAGLPSVLSADILAACADGVPDDHTLAALTVRMFGSAYPDRNGRAGEAVPAPEIGQYATVLLGVGGLMSLLPGNVTADAAQITVPVLLANGERDSLVGGAPDAAPFAQAADVAALTVPGAGHHLLAGSSVRQVCSLVQDWVLKALPTQAV